MAGRFCIIPSRALQDNRLNATDLKTLNALGSYTDKNGWCYPSQQTIADDIKAARMSVSRSIKKLCKHGYILSRPKFRADGSKTANEYKILFDIETPENQPSIAPDNKVIPPVTEELQGCNNPVTCHVTSECYNNERPSLTKKEETIVSSKKAKAYVLYDEVEVQHVEAWARENIPASINVAWELGRYKDHWKGSHKKPPKDGVAGFRNWLRNAKDYQEKGRQFGKSSSTHKDFHKQDYYANTDGFITD